ncbi:MAG TPA: glyceraldehyde-3-phosphate dehydrogenase [Candidatus Marinimicrobia bacterium]|nr:glyceraldehyde-3-phosphate dehydrogenase [Candidatus Neomarinimicrobiota bacterium]
MEFKKQKKEKVLGINGLGRIGKLSLWHHIGRRYFDRIVVNLGRGSGEGIKTIAEMVEKDTTYGRMHHFLKGRQARSLIKIPEGSSNQLFIDNIPVTFLTAARNPREINWRGENVELVVDTTGAFVDPTHAADYAKGSLRGHLEAGAKKLILSAPFKIKTKGMKMPEDAAMFIYGINHAAFDPAKHSLLAAASCTTTGLAHMIKPLLEHKESKEILTASMSTVHAATNSQSVLDTVPADGAKDLRKTRSILNNIILTSTGAAKALEQVIPEMNGIGFMADSVRIPTQTASLIILNITFLSELDEFGDSKINRNFINRLYKEAEEKNQGLLRVSYEQNVSADMIGEDAAVLIEGSETHTRTGFINLDLANIPGIDAADLKMINIPVTHAKIFGWYDNEYGSYTNRLAELTCYVHEMMI